MRLPLKAIKALSPPKDESPPRDLVNEMKEAARAARAETERKRYRGELEPLGINPETGKRLRNTGRYPKTGLYSPILKGIDNLATVQTDGRWRNRRERANELRERMAAFPAIYNAAWLVRDAYFGPDERRQRHVKALLMAMADELKRSQDYEAILFAVADALYCSKHGVPWEE